MLCTANMVDVDVCAVGGIKGGYSSFRFEKRVEESHHAPFGGCDILQIRVTPIRSTLPNQSSSSLRPQPLVSSTAQSRFGESPGIPHSLSLISARDLPFPLPQLPVLSLAPCLRDGCRLSSTPSSPNHYSRPLLAASIP